MTQRVFFYSLRATKLRLYLKEAQHRPLLSSIKHRMLVTHTSSHCFNFFVTAQPKHNHSQSNNTTKKLGGTWNTTSTQFCYTFANHLLKSRNSSIGLLFPCLWISCLAVHSPTTRDLWKSCKLYYMAVVPPQAIWATVTSSLHCVPTTEN